MDQISSHHASAASATRFSSKNWIEAVSPSMRAVEDALLQLAHSLVPVLLIGEKGSGKRNIALRIHGSSGIPGAFHRLDCSHAGDGFGLESPGSGDTLYFSEIGELSPNAQKELLRLLSQHNGNGSSAAHPRVICGSSHDLEPGVRNGEFREDLYYRLSGICLRIPPLRQRREDVQPLLEFFLFKYSEAFNRPVPSLSLETQDLLFGYSWPGNVEELESVARAIVALGDEKVVMGGLRSLLKHSDAAGGGEKVSLKEAARAASREAEKELILKVLARTRWNRRRAAQELQISYKALLYKLKQIGFGQYGA